MTILVKNIIRRWRLMLLGLLLLPLLAACVGLSNNYLNAEDQAALTPQARVFQVQAEFNQRLREYETYANQPFCRANLLVGCAEREVVIEGGNIATQVADALLAAQVAVKAGDSNAGAAAAVARVAIARFSAFVINRSIAQ